MGPEVETTQLLRLNPNKKKDEALKVPTIGIESLGILNDFDQREEFFFFV